MYLNWSFIINFYHHSPMCYRTLCYHLRGLNNCVLESSVLTHLFDRPCFMSTIHLNLASSKMTSIHLIEENLSGALSPVCMFSFGTKYPFCLGSQNISDAKLKPSLTMSMKKSIWKFSK